MTTWIIYRFSEWRGSKARCGPEGALSAARLGSCSLSSSTSCFIFHVNTDDLCTRGDCGLSRSGVFAAEGNGLRGKQAAVACRNCMEVITLFFFKNYVFVKQNPIDKEMNKSARTNAVHSRPSEDIVTVIKRPESALFLPPLGRVWLKYIYILLWKNKICNVHTALGRLK